MDYIVISGQVEAHLAILGLLGSAELMVLGIQWLHHLTMQHLSPVGGVFLLVLLHPPTASLLDSGGDARGVEVLHLLLLLPAGEFGLLDTEVDLPLATDPSEGQGGLLVLVLVEGPAVPLLAGLLLHRGLFGVVLDSYLLVLAHHFIHGHALQTLVLHLLFPLDRVH